MSNFSLLLCDSAAHTGLVTVPKSVEMSLNWLKCKQGRHALGSEDKFPGLVTDLSWVPQGK